MLHMEVNMSKNRDKFVELAQKRVTRAIRDLRLIGNLANKTNYSYTDADTKKILYALDNEVKNIKKRFENNSTDDKIAFKL